MQIEVDYPIECAAQCADILGEVPLWCERTQKLWWVDVRRPALQSYAPSTQHYQAIRLHPDWVTGSYAIRDEGGFLLATSMGLYLFDPDSLKVLQRIDHPEEGKPGMRLNDGKCDRQGRFWVGSMHDTLREPMGTLYQVDANHSVTPCSAALCFPTHCH